MTSLKKLKKQIEDANTLGIKNLDEKGVGLFASGNITTYQIMDAISMINVGGGGDVIIGADYTNIVYNTDNTITLTDKDGTEHTMSCTYEDGKLIGVLYDGKAVELTYDGDVLVKVGKTEIDMANAQTSGIELLDHTVTFTVDGEPYEIVSVKNGNSVNEPTVPNTNGNKFKGWQDSENNIISFPITPTEDVVLSAIINTSIAQPLFSAFGLDTNEYKYVVFSLYNNTRYTRYYICFSKDEPVITDNVENNYTWIISNNCLYAEPYDQTTDLDGTNPSEMVNRIKAVANEFTLQEITTKKFQAFSGGEHYYINTSVPDGLIGNIEEV